MFLYGEKETIFFNDSRYEVIPAPKGEAPSPPVGAPERRRVEAANDQQTAHVAEWLDAVRTRGKVSCPPEDAYRSTAAVQLAMIALKAGGRVDWDAATEQVTRQPEGGGAPQARVPRAVGAPLEGVRLVAARPRCRPGRPGHPALDRARQPP